MSSKGELRFVIVAIFIRLRLVKLSCWILLRQKPKINIIIITLS
jgi:hypothetical protein